MSATFDDFDFLKPWPDLHGAFANLQEFIGDLDGQMLCSELEEDVVVDEGTVDAENAVVAFNKIVAVLRSTHTAKVNADADGA